MQQQLPNMLRFLIIKLLIVCYRQIFKWNYLFSL